jgi:diamine N-acetyltransferase
MNPSLINQLTYGKVNLRALEPDDVNLLYSWENNMELWELSNTRTPFSKFILSEYIKNSARDIYESRQLRLIIENWERHPVGAIDLFDFDPYHMRAGVGILIHDSNERKKGYASDAIAALSEFSMNTLGLRQLYANVAADNLKSIKLFEKAGFVRNGVKKYWLKTASGWKDEYFFQKLML